MDRSTPDPAQQWDQRYQESDRLWSGNVNSALASMVRDLAPGDGTGCGLW